MINFFIATSEKFNKRVLTGDQFIFSKHFLGKVA